MEKISNQGRYLKALVDRAQNIASCKIGDYFLIIKDDARLIKKCNDGCLWNYSEGGIDQGYWELMPIGFNPSNKNLTFKTYI